MSSSDVKIEKSKLLQKYTYIKTTPYIIETTKLTQRLQPKQKTLGLLTAILLLLQTKIKIGIIMKRTK